MVQTTWNRKLYFKIPFLNYENTNTTLYFINLFHLKRYMYIVKNCLFFLINLKSILLFHIWYIMSMQFLLKPIPQKFRQCITLYRPEFHSLRVESWRYKTLQEMRDVLFLNIISLEVFIILCVKYVQFTMHIDEKILRIINLSKHNLCSNSF